MKLIDITRFVGQVVFTVHWFGIVEGSIEEGVNVLHEGASHLSFSFVLRLWRGNEYGFFAFARAMIFPSRKMRVRTVGGGRRSVDGRRGVISRGATKGLFENRRASIEGMSRGPFLATVAPIGGAVNVGVSQVEAMRTKARGKLRAKMTAELGR